MRPTLMTYEIFCEAVEKMQAQSEKISVRTVLSHTGGSFSTVASYLKRWREEKAHAQEALYVDISTNLRQAILSEVGKVVLENRAILEARLKEKTEELEETQEALQKQEKETQGYQEEVIVLRQRTAVLEELKAHQSHELKSLEKKLEERRQKEHEADKRATIAETRLIELERQLIKLEEARPPRK